VRRSTAGRCRSPSHSRTAPQLSSSPQVRGFILSAAAPNPLSRLPALALACALAALSLLLIGARAARAAARQQSVFEADTELMADPAGTISQLRLLGAQTIRLAVRWQAIAPDPNSRRPPRHFDGSDPAAYPAAKWAIWDQIVRDASQAGIAVVFNVAGGAPRWALGPGEPQHADNADWDPSASMYGAFVQALGTRYSGEYDPSLGRTQSGDANDLPRVSLWSIWNEPNYGPSLAPQGVPRHEQVPNSPRYYRGLVDAAWSALHRTGHGPDTILIGEVAPRGLRTWGLFSGMKPLIFVRELYCLDTRYRPYRGAAAAARGCPTTAAGSRRFRARNPALFEAAGFSDHPYMRWYPPDHEGQPDPNYASLGEIGNLERALNRAQRAYGSGAQMPVWDTEFGYITDPPKHRDQGNHWVSPQTAAYYLNWAEYLSWRDPRIMSFSQYLLRDPLPARKSNDWGGYASGLLTYSGSRKATYDAWRLPIYLPVTTASRGERLSVWGCARPALFALRDTGQPQSVQIEFEPASGGGFQTEQTMTISTGSSSCYFNVPVAFPGSGTVRLEWDYPASDPQLGNYPSSQPAYSRYVQITLR
jgi:hypothetical protein